VNPGGKFWPFDSGVNPGDKVNDGHGATSAIQHGQSPLITEAL
jgi:hypothetical protein